MPKYKTPPKGALFETPLAYGGGEHFRQLAYIFDNNILPHLNVQPGEGQGLGNLLHALRDPLQPRETVVLLPAVAEANYRAAGGAETVLRKYQSYYEQYFGRYGIRELGAFSLGNTEQTPEENLLEVAYRVLANYWLLCCARQALEHRKKKTDRAAAVERFFKIVGEVGCFHQSAFPLFTVATALVGNVPGANALNIKDSSVKALMNGSWDLLYWHAFVRLYLDSATTGRIPRLYSYDSDAVGIFLKMKFEENEVVRFAHESDSLEAEFNESIRQGMNTVSRTNSDCEEQIQKLHEVLPTAYHCKEYLRARALFWDTLAICNAQELSALTLMNFVLR